MCFMRPTADQLCSPLPFMLPAPEPSLQACGVPPRPLPPDLVLLPEVMVAQSRPRLDSTHRAEVAQSLAHALAHDGVMPDTSALRSAWRDLLDPPAGPLAAALREPGRMRRLVLAAESEDVCDTLLRRCADASACTHRNLGRDPPRRSARCGARRRPVCKPCAGASASCSRAMLRERCLRNRTKLNHCRRRSRTCSRCC